MRNRKRASNHFFSKFFSVAVTMKGHTFLLNKLDLIAKAIIVLEAKITESSCVRACVCVLKERERKRGHCMCVSRV